MRGREDKQIKEKLGQISRSRDEYDNKFQQLQHFIHTKCKSDSHTKNATPFHQVRKEFAQRIQIIKAIVKSNKDALGLLKYKSSRLEDSKNVEGRIQSLEEYFDQLSKKIANQYKKGQQIISARQRWQVTGKGKSINGGNNENDLQDDESSALINSLKDIKSTTQNARNVYTMLTEQGNKMSQARQKMGSVLKNINFAGNILNMIRTRSRQDNKLITYLSIGLIIQLFLCLFVIKPWVRGQ